MSHCETNICWGHADANRFIPLVVAVWRKALGIQFELGTCTWVARRLFLNPKRLRRAAGAQFRDRCVTSSFSGMSCISRLETICNS